jgi:vancomycin resistance protein YoaR
MIFNGNKKKIIASLVVVITLVATLGYIFQVKNTVAKWESKIYPGVNVYGIDLGGKTKEEAVEILKNQLATSILDKVITVTVGDKKFELKYSDIEPTINIEKTVEEALAFGKKLGMFDKNSSIKRGVDHTVETEMDFNEEGLKTFEGKVNDAVEIKAVDAQINVGYGGISVTPEKLGKKIDIDELHSKLIAAINPNPEDLVNITMELKDYSPKVTSEQLNKINGIISSFSSTYNNTGDGRVTNMKLAAQYINGTLLMPGDEFSYNKTIGQTTAERGFAEANTYVGSEIVPNYGGGVCQISTSLYRAAMRANLKSTLRYNHSMMVSYAEPSLDATVFEGDIDYRFINTYDFPIYIEGAMSGSYITFNIYGNKEGMGGKTYELVNEIIEKYDYKTEYVDDNTLEQGKQITKINGAVGYKSNGYLVTYENGVEVNRELVSTDIYQPMNSVVLRGTKKVETKEVKSEASNDENTSNTTVASNNNTDSQGQQ